MKRAQLLSTTFSLMLVLNGGSVSCDLAGDLAYHTLSAGKIAQTKSPSSKVVISVTCLSKAQVTP